jgi:hypothetical protein
VVGRQIVFCEKHEDRVYCYGYDGTELWNREVKGYAQTLVGAGSEGLDLILFESPAGAFPYVLNVGRREQMWMYKVPEAP